MTHSCINAYDTNKTLEATFRFIYQNQKLPNGKYLNTRIYLATALKTSQSYEDYKNRNEAFNLVSGIVVEVKENYLKMQTSSMCPNDDQIYIVAYSDISSIISETLFENIDKYKAYMSSLPKICACRGDRYYDLLVRLEKELSTMKESELLHTIYSGIFSFGYTKDQYSIIGNLILLDTLGWIDNASLSPITAVSGFFVVEGKDTKHTKKENVVVDNDIIKGCM